MDMHGEMGPIADKMAKAMADAPGLGQVSLELASHAFRILLRTRHSSILGIAGLCIALTTFGIVD